MNKLVSILALLVSMTVNVQAEDDLDFEFDFTANQKSTLADFPFKEIGYDELSDAAIGGALQASSTAATEESGKPAYAEQGDKEEKQQKAELEVSDSSLINDDFLRQSLLPSTPQVPQQVYQEYNGRTMVGHSFTAFER